MKNLALVDDAQYVTGIKLHLETSLPVNVELVDIFDEDYAHIDQRNKRYDLVIYEPYYLLDDRLLEVVNTIEAIVQNARIIRAPVIALSSQQDWALAQEEIVRGQDYDVILYRTATNDQISTEVRKRLGI